MKISLSNEVTDDWAKNAYINEEKYNTLYKQSIENPDRFWGEQGKRIKWIKPYSKVKNTSY